MSIFGLIYLVLCFWFLYRGSNLLTDPRKTRIKWSGKDKWMNERKNGWMNGQMDE